MIDFLAHLLQTPSDFAGDPAGLIGNQSAHALLVGAGATAALAWAFPPRFAAFLVAGLYAVWEATQFFFGAGLLDALTDWSFVAAGCALAWSITAGSRLWAQRLIVGIGFAALLAAG